MRKLIYILFSITMLSFSVYAQNVKFNANIRPRLIIDGKDFNSNTGMNSYTELRTRFGAEFSPLSDLTGFVQLQDSRVYGNEPSTLANTQNVDLHQAYFQINDLFKLPIDLKVGRMEAPYGNQRLMGAVGWSNVGRSFDGLTIKYKSDNVKLDLFAFREVESGKPADSSDQNVIGAYSYINAFEGHSLQPFVICYSSYSAAYPFNTFTLGANLAGNINSFHHEAEFAYQGGSEVYNGPRSVKAFMAAYNFNFTFNTEVKPMLGAGVDYLSGDDNFADNDYKVFNTLFATNHKFYGYMDYFINIPANTFGLGLMDIHATAGIKPLESLGLKAAYHIFNSAQDAVFADGSTSKSFGSELDFTLDYKYNKNVAFQFGAGFFSPGKIFETARGKDSASWMYLMGVVSL